jgi:hypothetical protein
MLRIKILGLDIYGCREALERLDDYVDHELSPEEERKVRQHLKICRYCLSKFKFQEELLAGLRSKVQAIPASADVEDLQNKISVLLKQEVKPGSDSKPPS